MKTWNDKDFVAEIINEIIDVHKNYEKFSELNVKDAKKYLFDNLEISI